MPNKYVLFSVLLLSGASFIIYKSYYWGYDKCSLEQAQAEIEVNKKVNAKKSKQDNIDNSFDDVSERLLNGTF